MTVAEFVEKWKPHGGTAREVVPYLTIQQTDEALTADLQALLVQREEEVRATIVAMIQAISQCRQGSKDLRGIDPMEDEDGWRDLTLSEQQLLNGIAKTICAGKGTP